MKELELLRNIAIKKQTIDSLTRPLAIGMDRSVGFKGSKYDEDT